ncbi:MAG TPA: alanine racemase [Victivallales bacterium]|nr:alanine racemase [Victivallales bacterium]
MNIHELETPCLILDKDKLTNNIDSMTRHISTLGVEFRPHVKTAKCIEIIELATEKDCCGITVSTLKEADYFFEKGIKNIIYAVGIAPVKLKHVSSLIKKGADILIILDSIEQAKIVASAGKEHNVKYSVLLEIDTDGHRSGIKPFSNELIEIGKFIHNNDHTNLSGILTHAGESYNCRSIEEIQKIAVQEHDLMVSSAEMLNKNNLPCPIVSIGSTPTAEFTNNLSGITEIRAGVYMFNDLVMAGLGVCKVEDIAISVLASVIGYQREKNWIIVDAGWMSLSRDRGTANQKIDQGYGLVCDIEGKFDSGLIVSGVNQEHGIITTRNREKINFNNFPIGTMVRILPNHACATASAYDCYNVINSNSTDISDVWKRINGW